MIIPRTAQRAHRRPVARAVAALTLTASAIVLGVFGAATPAVADPTEDPSDPTTDGSVALEVSLGTHGAIPAGSPISGTVTVDNGTGESVGEARVELEIDPTPLADSSAVSAWLGSGAGADALTPLFSAPTAAVPAGGDLDTPIAATSDLVQQLPPGVYAVNASFSAPAGGQDAEADDTSARTVLTVRPAATAQVSVVVPITATPASGALLTADELSELTGTDGALTAQLDGVTGSMVILAVDPAIPAAIRVLGESAPAAAVAWLDRLEALPNETFALQFGDADLATQAHAGLGAALAPTTLDPFMTAADFPADESPTPTPAPSSSASPTPSPTPSDTVELPDLAELTALRGELTGIVWPRGDVATDDLATFDVYLGEPATTIVPSTSVAEPVASGHAVVGGSSVLVSDTEASAILSAAAAEPDEALRESLLAQANAELSFSGAPASGILIGLERDEARTADALRDVLQTSGAAPLRSLRGTTPGAVTLASEPDAVRATKLTTLLADEDALEAFGSILDDPQVLLAPERIRLMRVIAVGLDDSAFETGYADLRAATVTTLGSVGVQEPAPIQLISANVDLPVWIRNDLPWPVNLMLRVDPSDSRVAIEPYTQVQAQANTNTRVLIPVQSRVASGELDVTFTLSSPTGVPIGSPETAEVTVRAEWENIGLGILGSLIVLLLAFGIVRTVLRRRRDRAVAAEDADATASSAATASDEGDR
ncbi:DUF6049 family protein [Microbacterium sp. M28]|uniref:DUF6049 family protein n=1 Tax=Microbacterium sp. M28 TaxID=2962064 RepID=UPI0021F4B99D|nr:DUF6049 family protein [Microbacterium sp. M28]UYO97135.1 DUF6049 family protein [Microbacterium sp. M28]